MSEQRLFAEEAEEYRLPPLAEILERDWNGLTAVSSFSGCGGSCLGFKMAGYRIPYAIEFVPAAAETYIANFPDTYVDTRDVRDVKAEEILDRIGLERGELDVFEGSPPCASFSSAGSGAKSWGEVKKYSDTEQRTDDLFWEYVRLLDGLSPRAFVAENVPGMLNGKALEKYAYRVVRSLEEAGDGYRVRATILNACHYGVPQVRERLIFVGFRRDDPLGGFPEGAFPPKRTTTVPHTIRQALTLVDPDAPGEAEDRADSSMEGKAVGRTWHKLRGDGKTWVDPESLGRMCETCGASLERHTVPITLGNVKELTAAAKLIGVSYETRNGKAERYVSLAEAEEWVLGGGESRGITTTGKVKTARCANGQTAVIVKAYFMLVVPKMDEPSPTVTATGAGNGAASVTHPEECRKFTPREAMAVCGFPQDFQLVGTREQRYERMGRAVPPPFMAAIAGAVRDALA